MFTLEHNTKHLLAAKIVKLLHTRGKVIKQGRMCKVYRRTLSQSKRFVFHDSCSSSRVVSHPACRKIKGNPTAVQMRRRRCESMLLPFRPESNGKSNVRLLQFAGRPAKTEDTKITSIFGDSNLSDQNIFAPLDIKKVTRGECIILFLKSCMPISLNRCPCILCPSETSSFLQK